MQSGYGKKVEGPKRTHIIVEMVVRILAILFGSFCLLVSSAFFLETGTRIFQVPIIRFFTGEDEPFYLGTVGYAIAIAIVGIVMQTPILIGRILIYNYVSENVKIFQLLPVTIILSFFLALAHFLAGILCAVVTGEIDSNISGRDGIPRLTDSNVLELRNTAISNIVFSFSGMVLYGSLGAWEIFMATQGNSY